MIKLYYLAFISDNLVAFYQRDHTEIPLSIIDAIQHIDSFIYNYSNKLPNNFPDRYKLYKDNMITL